MLLSWCLCAALGAICLQKMVALGALRGQQMNCHFFRLWLIKLPCLAMSLLITKLGVVTNH
jgi:hypothetical protein